MKHTNNKDRQLSKVSRGIHNKTIDDLVTRLSKSENYDTIKKEQNYNFIYEGHLIYGEIDTYAITTVNKKRYVLLFEIKSTDSYRNCKKGCHQLDKDENYFKSLHIGDRYFKFYVTKDKIKYIK